MLQTLIQNFIAATPREEKEKKSFWATDSEKDVFEIYHKWKGTPETNLPDAQTVMTWDAGSRMEDTIVEMFKKMDILVEAQKRVEIKYGDVTISGKIDALVKYPDNGIVPVEIKTFYGDYQQRQLQDYKPKTSYLKQLGLYLLAEDKNHGVLLYRDRGVGQLYEFPLLREGYNFKCGSIEFNLEETFKKYERLYNQNILKDIVPKPQFRYKYPIEEIDWKSISKSKIADARNNRAVIGDWQVKYSSYKNLYLEYEKTGLGYSEEELKRINELTKGYTSKDYTTPMWSKESSLVHPGCQGDGITQVVSER